MTEYLENFLKFLFSLKLVDAIANIGPIDVGIYVSTSFQNYQSGIFSDPSYVPSMNNNHDLLAIGYGTENNF